MADFNAFEGSFIVMVDAFLEGGLGVVQKQSRKLGEPAIFSNDYFRLHAIRCAGTLCSEPLKIFSSMGGRGIIRKKWRTFETQSDFPTRCMTPFFSVSAVRAQEERCRRRD